MRRLVCVVSLCLFVLPCSVFAQKVDVDYDRGADFSGLETWAWREGTRAENTLMHQRIVAGVEYHMSMKGFVRVEKDPDFFVTYHGSSSEAVAVDTRRSTYTGSDWYTRPGGTMGGKTKIKRTYTKGTLMVDILGADSEKLLWHGEASDSVSNSPEKNEKKINQALEKMFKEFPPPRK